MFIKLLLFNLCLSAFLLSGHYLYYFNKKWIKKVAIIPYMLAGPVMGVIGAEWFKTSNTSIMIYLFVTMSIVLIVFVILFAWQGSSLIKKAK